MGFETPPSSGNKDNKPEDPQQEQAEHAGDPEKENEQEESIGPRAAEYRDAAGVSHSTYSLREGLDEETLEKLEKMKDADQDDDEDSGEMKKAA